MKSKIGIDYKKELETASKGMILIHDPTILIKLIVRMIVGKVKIKHAGMILHDPIKDNYVLSISRGEVGVKIPAGYTRFDRSNPLIQIFLKKDQGNYIFRKNALVIEDLSKLIWQESVIKGTKANTELLHRGIEQMQMYNVVACVPAYFQDKLMAVLLLGHKFDEEQYDQDELDFFAALASDVAMAIRNAQLFSDLKKEADRNHNLFLQTTVVLASTIEAKDVYTRGHTERVTQYALAIARQMKANGSVIFEDKFFEDLYIAGILHDIGKIAVPEAILTKIGKLSPEEYEIMKTHPSRGVEIIKHLSELKESIKGVLYHHERYDGKGYPEGLKGEAIPIMAAIIAVADTYDAMTSDRPYRKGLPKNQAINEIMLNSGIQFNPLCVKAMVELFEKGEV